MLSRLSPPAPGSSAGRADAEGRGGGPHRYRKQRRSGSGGELDLCGSLRLELTGCLHPGEAPGSAC